MDEMNIKVINLKGVKIESFRFFTAEIKYKKVRFGTLASAKSLVV